MPRRFLRLGVLLSGAFGLRVAFFFIHGAPLEFPDSAVYNQMALNLCAGVGLIQDAHTAVSRPPLYPLILAACYTLFGPNPVVVALMQAALGAVTVFLVFHLTQEVFDERAAWIAAVVTALYPFFIFYSALILTETLFIALLALSMILLLRAWRKGSLTIGALAGVTFGLGTLTRSSLIGFIYFLLPIWLIVSGKRWRRGLLTYAAIAAGLLLTLIPWALRNYAVTGHLVFTTLQGGHDLYEANSPQATGGPIASAIDWDKVTEGKRLTEYERDRLLRQEALNYIRRHPDQFARLAVIKLARFWSPIPNYEKYRSGLYNMVSLLSFGPIAILAVVGIVQTRSRWKEMLLLLTPVCYYSVLHMVFVGSVRYRTPVEVCLIALAAGATAGLLHRFKRSS